MKYLAHQVKGRGPGFIWGHGLMSCMAQEDQSQWFRWPDFPEQVQLIRYDARGHGGSTPYESGNDYAWPQLSSDMLSLADDYLHACFIAGGQSMGAATALYTALQTPQRVTALILVTPPSIWTERQKNTDMYERIATLLRQKGNGFMADLLKMQPVLPRWLAKAQPQANAAYVKTVSQMAAQVPTHLYEGAALSDFPGPEVLRQINIPTLVLAWSEDPRHPMSTAHALVEHMPNAELHIATDVATLRSWPSLIQSFVINLKL